MQINITFLIQIISFIFYIFFCIKYIWPYVNDVLNKRKKKLYLKFKEIKNAKLKINNLKNKIKEQKILNKEIILKINNDLEYTRKYLLKKYKKEAIFKYNKIIKNAELKINIKKKIMYDNFNKNVSNIIYIILKQITYKIFNKKLDNKFINKILSNNKLN